MEDGKIDELSSSIQTEDSRPRTESLGVTPGLVPYSPKNPREGTEKEIEGRESKL